MSSSVSPPSSGGVGGGGAPIPPPSGGTGGGATPPSGGAPPLVNYTETSEFALWEKYEAVAMHFNELIIRLRTQAVGGLAGVLAISGFAVNSAQKSDSGAQWIIVFGTLFFFLWAWAALWILDTQYYDKLLEGAVKAIVAHEEKSAAGINLSTMINKQIPNYRCTVHGFYIFVALPLLIGTIYVGIQAFGCVPKLAKKDIVKYKIELSTPNGLKVNSEPAKIEHEIQFSIPKGVKVIAEPAKAP